MKIAPITKGGQISVPASARKRWGTKRVLIDDQGDRLVVTPMPDDPVEAAHGALAGALGDVTIEELRRQAREDERRAEERKWSYLMPTRS